jgi:hypothetical protein
VTSDLPVSDLDEAAVRVTLMLYRSVCGRIRILTEAGEGMGEYAGAR